MDFGARISFLREGQVLHTSASLCRHRYVSAASHAVLAQICRLAGCMRMGLAILICKSSGVEKLRSASRPLQDMSEGAPLQIAGPTFEIHGTCQHAGRLSVLRATVHTAGVMHRCA